MKKKYIVHIEDSPNSGPRPHEKKAAEILTELFKSNLIFMRRGPSKTPDLYVIETNMRWELKSPKGGSKHTVQNNLREAGHQSENVILDLSRAKLSDQQGASRARQFMRDERSRIKHLKILAKDRRLIDIK